METYKQILLYNRSWAQAKRNTDSEYFKRLSISQNPLYLWIGCSDSRVPAEEITGANPGDFFVHRNIANIANANDPNFLSVLKYAVDFLKVKHVVVCGHHGCGGCTAAINDLQDEHLTPWIKEIRDTYLENIEDINKHKEECHRVDNLAELNVFKQVDGLSKNPIIRDAWKRGQEVFIHGWIFNLRTGEIDSLKEIAPNKIPEEWRK
ncbi:MAG: carbonic anhydrase [Mangrovibacterium sp.]